MNKLRRVSFSLSLSILLFMALAHHSFSISVFAEPNPDGIVDLISKEVGTLAKDAFAQASISIISKYTSADPVTLDMLYKECGFAWSMYQYCATPDSLIEDYNFASTSSYTGTFYYSETGSAPYTLGLATFNTGVYNTSSFDSFPFIGTSAGDYTVSCDVSPTSYVFAYQSLNKNYEIYTNPSSSHLYIFFNGVFYYNNVTDYGRAYFKANSVPPTVTLEYLSGGRPFHITPSSINRYIFGQTHEVKLPDVTFRPSSPMQVFSDLYDNLVSEYGQELVDDNFVFDLDATPDIVSPGDLTGFDLPPNLPYESFPVMELPEMDLDVITSSKNASSFYFNIINTIVETFNIKWVVILMLLLSLFFMIFAR